MGLFKQLTDRRTQVVADFVVGDYGLDFAGCAVADFVLFKTEQHARGAEFNVELCPTGVLFRFEKYEISYGAAGEVEAIVPYYEIRNYLRPAVRELLEQTHGWTECGRDD